MTPKLTKPQHKELVRRHNLSLTSRLVPIPMQRGQRIVCQRLRKLRLLDKSLELTVLGTQRALELGGDVPKNAAAWVDEQAARFYKQAAKRRDETSEMLKALGESDLEDDAFRDAVDEAAAKLKSDDVL